MPRRIRSSSGLTQVAAGIIVSPESEMVASSIMKLLVTAGPTREPIDPVRFISNRSSGRMGYALARVGRRRGHEVRLVSGPVCLAAPRGVTLVSVTTSCEMESAVRRNIEWCDALVMAAAVADWKPRKIARQKLKKARFDGMLELEAAPDILMSVRDQKGGRVYVGFAAETGNLRREARRKLKEKGLDMIVANDVSRPDSGFESESNKAILITPSGKALDLPLMSKEELAGQIIEWIESKTRRVRPIRRLPC